MRNEVRAAAVQFDSTWLDPEANARRIGGLIRREAENGVDLLVFPELATTGYFAPAGTAEVDPEFREKFHRLAEPVDGPTVELLAAAAAEAGIHAAVGILEREGDAIYNSMCLLGPSGVVGTYRKVHLPVAEKHYFEPGDEIPVFDTPLGGIGMSICFDGRFPELTRTLALNGAEIICSGWAVIDWPGVIIDESQLFRAYTRAQENGTFYIAANRSGVEGPAVFTGHSVIAGPNGGILGYSESRGECTIAANLRAEELNDYRALLNVLECRRPELYELGASAAN